MLCMLRCAVQDPSIDPKRARRIMANRLSAAKSKMKQKSVAQVGARQPRGVAADGEGWQESEERASR